MDFKVLMFASWTKIQLSDIECESKLVNFDLTFFRWSRKKMKEICKQCCELAKFIETKEQPGIIEYDEESQHLEYLFENQKKKYKMYQQALKMRKAFCLRSY